MVIPKHYSLDIPARCLALLDLCEPVVKGADEQGQFGGPLTTTLLLALATPMINLPIERIYKNVDIGESEGMADDRQINPQLASRLDTEIRQKKLRQNGHFGNLQWSFVKDVKPFNIAHELSDELAGCLATPEAHEAAQAMEMPQFISCLRNAMSHGGIMYLDDNGQSTRGQAGMLLFVSAKQIFPQPVFDEKKRKCVISRPITESVRLLRISEENFRAFLRCWVEWLLDLGVIDAREAA